MNKLMNDNIEKIWLPRLFYCSKFETYAGPVPTYYAAVRLAAQP